MRTKIFQNGNSQAIRIPAQIAYESNDIELDIVRDGDKLIIQPAPRSPADILRRMKPLADFMAKGRGQQGQNEREPL
jgi:antitoxin VapB